VVVYNGKNDLKNVEVNIIKTVGDKTYISSGLEIGQRIITKNQLLIFNQMVGN
jgi:cobalt-zinc-cadmium efflux system membrane fusion protein